jgi:tetratricopeptide (TPR) repeat protein
MAYQNSGNTTQALNEYQQAIQLNPSMSFINVNIGNCYLNLNQPDSAVPFFQRYLEQNPSAPDAAQVRMSIQQAGSRKGQQNLRSIVEQGQALLNSHRYNEAAQAFQQAIAIDPNFAPAHFFLGYSLAQSAQYEQAIAEFKRALEITPNMPEAVINIASNYQSMGDTNSATSWYQKFLQENPSSPKASEIRSRLSALQKQASRNPGIGSAIPPNNPESQGQSDYFNAVENDGHYFRWSSDKMPIRVFISPGPSVPGYRDSFRQVLMQAFSAWAVGSGNKFVFAPAPDSSQADIICEWTSDAMKVADGGQSVEGGLTRLSGQAQPGSSDVSISRARMIILTIAQDSSPLSDEAMKKVCLHEVGHALGLNGHSTDNHDVMFFTEAPSVWPALSKRDKATISRLYANYPPFAGTQ